MRESLTLNLMKLLPKKIKDIIINDPRMRDTMDAMADKVIAKIRENPELEDEILEMAEKNSGMLGEAFLDIISNKLTQY